MVRKIQKCLKGTCDGIKLSEIIEFDELYLSVGEKGNSELSRPPTVVGKVKYIITLPICFLHVIIDRSEVIPHIPYPF